MKAKAADGERMTSRFASFLGHLMGIIVLSLSSTSSFAAEDKRGRPMLSFPLTAGDATRVEATVAFVSDGFRAGGCKTVKSSGNEIADAQACKTVSYYKTKTPIYAITSVWVAPPFEGEFVPPVIRNSKSINVPGSYPSIDLAKGNQGTATVKLILSPDGKVTDCSIAQSSGYASLDRVTCRLQRRGRYKPAVWNEEPTVAVIYTTVFWGAGSGPPKR